MARIIIEPEGGDNIKSLIRIAVENELKVIRSGIARTSRRLKELEKKYSITSQVCYERFSRGELGDDMEYIRWAGEIETLQQLDRDYAELSEIQLCS